MRAQEVGTEDLLCRYTNSKENLTAHPFKYDCVDYRYEGQQTYN